MSKTILKAIPVWILVSFFVVGGATNMIAPEGIVQDYRRWGYPDWFHYVTGVLELAAAALLAYAPVRLWGVAAGAAVMFGALGTLLLHGEYVHAIPSIIVLAVLSFVAVTIRQQFRIHDGTMRR